MNYVSQAQTPKPAALLASVAIPLGVGALLATSLAFTVVIDTSDPGLEGYDVEIELPPPPPKPDTIDPVVDTPVPETATQDVIIPDPKIELKPGPSIPTSDFEIPTIEIPIPSAGSGTAAIPTPAPNADPIRAVPRNNPGSWITEGDYRTRWINEGLTGVARFSLPPA